MRKELIWAGVIGITFGLIIAFGVWRINSSIKSNSPIATSTPIPQGIESNSITLDKPENDDVITENSVTVSGLTRPLSWVVVSGEQGDYIVQSDEGGVFSQDVDLTSGVNQIKVTLLDKSGNQTFQKVLVVYSALFQLATSAPTATTSAATSDANISETVKEKVIAASLKPKAYLGTVTDIADSTIQIKTLDAQIAQIAVGNPGITVVNQVGTNNKTVKLTDVAIGDFIVAMGYINQNSVLAAQRILITDPVTEPKINISMEKVTTVSKKALVTANVNDGSAVTLTPDKNTDIESYSGRKNKAVKITDISVNDVVISVSDNTGSPAILRSVFDIGTI